MVIEISLKGFKNSKISRAYSTISNRYDKLIFALLLLTTSWFIRPSNSFQQHQIHNGKQHGYGGQFLAEEEAEAISIEGNARLAKIPCNFTTKTNCIYAEQEKLSSANQRNQQNRNEIIVSWVPFSGTINSTTKTFLLNNSKSIVSDASNNVREKHQHGLYNFNWIFELLMCMMLASAFEICLLVLRNLRNISVAFFGFWTAFNASLQKLCGASNETTKSSSKSDPHRKRNVPLGEKRTLSYIFAILTWRASQTSKNRTNVTHEGSTDQVSQTAISYGNFTTMGDLLLLILFTHVYYQRQRFTHEHGEHEANADTDQAIECHKEGDQNSTVHQKLYDKQNNDDSNNVLHEQNFPKRSSSKRCSHFCGNMHQQISSCLEDRKSVQTKLTTLPPCTTKIPYVTYCSCVVWYTCCFCQYSCRLCCYCCSNCRRWNQRCHINIPLCNTVYCCCFHKSLKAFHEVNYQYCCYLCCFPDFCHIRNLCSHMGYRCYCYHIYCCFCNNKTNPLPVWTINLLLLNNARNLDAKICSTPSTDDYCLWKFMWNDNSYSLFYQEGQQSYLVLHVEDVKTIFANKRTYYQFAADVLCRLLPQHFLATKNCQTLLKWKRLYVTVVIMALIFICASSGGANHGHHQYYSSFINRGNKHFYRCRQSKKRRRRRRRRHQHCKAYRPQHYFYSTLIQCVKRQKAKKLNKKFINKLHKKSAKLLISTLANFESSLGPTAMPTKSQLLIRSIKRVRGSKPNIVWLLIGLIWFEGPKMVNCNVIINYQNQQQHEQQQQQHQQQTGHMPQEAATNSININFEHKVDNFIPIKTKNNNSNNNSNNSSNKNYKNNVNSINNNNNNNSNHNSSSNSTNNGHKNSINKNSNSSNSNNIHLSVNLIPIINTIHFKHYCNSNYHQKLMRSSQRVQRALKTNSNWKPSITSSASSNNNNVNDDLDSEQMPSPALQTLNEVSHAQSDLMRLESIKHQILFKLGLTRKPNVSHPLPKQFIWDTIYRADGIKSFHDFSNTNNFPDHRHFTPQRSYPSWPKTSHKITNAMPIMHHPQRQQRDDRSLASQDSVENIKRSIGSFNAVRKKFRLNKLTLQQKQTNFNRYNSNNMLHRKGVSTTASVSKNFNQFLYATANRNKSIRQPNATDNDLTILKQLNKHQQFHKNSPHSTTTTTTQQQNIRQHELNQHTNNNNNNNNNNRNYRNNINNSNNVNDSNNNNNNNNSNNNIIMVQKHLRNSNKHIEGAKKFTYLTDINSSDDDSSNNMKEYHNIDSDDNNTVFRKKNHQHNLHDHDRVHVKPLQLQQNADVIHERTTEKFQHFNIDGFVDIPGDVSVAMDTAVIHDDEDEIGSDNDDDNDDSDSDNDNDQYYQQHQHDKYFSKSEAFDENEDFFGSTQEIITFAEKGKMYKNHRLVEFSHQNNENPKQRLHVRHAEIHIRIDKISFKNRSRVGSGIKRKRLKIWIFQLIENNYTYKGFDHVAKFCASFEVDTSRLGWKKFDITSTVKEWYSRREEDKLRLLIDCTGCGKMYSVHLFNGNNAKGDITIRERRIADQRRNANSNDARHKLFYNNTYNNDKFRDFQYNETRMATEEVTSDIKNNMGDENADDDVLNSSRPFLVLHTEAKKQRRVRRRAINCNGALHGQCCKESFYVSFKALGWDDWIIAPRGYFANYCRGDCTGPYRTPDTFQTFHAHFIEEYRKMGLLNGMQPCCAPIKFSSMSLIYYGDEGIIKRDLPKMVVDECGCP